MGHLKNIKKPALNLITFILVIICIFLFGITETAGASTTAATVNNKNTDQVHKVPVYGKKQKAKIKKYLSSLPGKITVKEAKKRGIVIQSYNNKGKKYFQKEWMDFYKYVRTGEKQYSPKDSAITCYAQLNNKRAITILRYTIEGGPIYTYLSFINGKYYMLNDSSRDNFKAPSWDGYSDLMVYKSLRKYKNCIYLFKKQGITSKQVKKIIESPSNSKYYKYYYNILDFNN